jgi:hypothetical protein
VQPHHLGVTAQGSSNSDLYVGVLVFDIEVGFFVKSRADKPMIEKGLSIHPLILLGRIREVTLRRISCAQSRLSVWIHLRNHGEAVAK